MTTSTKLKSSEPIEPTLGVDPFTYLTDLFTFFLQGLFEHDHFRHTGMHYVGGPYGATEDSEIIITAEKPALEAIEKIPHIVVILGSAQWANLSLDQLQHHVAQNGRRTHTDLVSMNMSYHCQAKDGLLARRIAWFSGFYTIVLRRILMRQGNLHQVSPRLNFSAEMGPSAFAGKKTEEDVVSVVVSVPFFWQPKWSIEDAEPERLKGMELGIRSEAQATLCPRGRPFEAIPLEPEEEPSEPLLQDTVIGQIDQ